MNYVFHPIRTYRDWRETQKLRCVVQIEHPRMKIKGIIYWNNAVSRPCRYETYVGFLGIPYAAPPVGRLRFQPPETLPQPSPPLCRKLKTIKAYNSFHPCLQLSKNLTFFGSEDCLYLNVYMPKKPEEIPELLPVLVYIHGGAFTHGHNSRNFIQPDNMLQHDLVFVTINYRLGPFGFLNMGTKDCRGNAGLKDQVKALEWVRDNIVNFKGDPSNVTICGHSAGATCVNLHLFSPLSKGLFRRAIIMSGGISCPWGFKNLQHVEKARQIYRRSVSAKVMTNERVVSILSRMEAIDVMHTVNRIISQCSRRETMTVLGLLGPSEEHISEGAFIPSDKPLERLMEEAAPVSVMAGIARKEGYVYFPLCVRNGLISWHYLRMIQDPDSFTKFLQQNLSWSKETAEKRRDELRTMYFGDAETLQGMDFDAIQTRLTTFLTDLWFHRFYDNLKIGKEWPTSEPLYVYQYDYLFDIDKTRELGSVTVVKDGAGHGDEIELVFKSGLIRDRTEREFPAETIYVVQNLCSLLANFCKNGIPRSEWEEVEWSPHSEDNPSYLNIGKDLAVRPGRLNEDSWPKLRDIIMSEPVVEYTEESLPGTSRVW